MRPDELRRGGEHLFGSFNPHPTRRPDAADGRRASDLTYWEFQSSPDPKAGCGLPSRVSPVVLPCFNPHPTRRPDAALCVAGLHPAHGVSILTRPEGRMRRGGRGHPGLAGAVSILTRPEGRMRRVSGLPADAVAHVSILTRPEGRMRPPRRRGPPSGRGFNPHPTRRPDAAGSAVTAGYSVTRFQSSPDPKAGCGRRGGSPTTARPGSFQSSPDPKAGCGRARGRICYCEYSVSILTRPEGRMRLGQPGPENARFRVSILTRPEGRMRLRVG